uniref:(northern house mosquito) hypothetical protein n=1 Tax=Culex pipiens TaxID=7175 RepID=A0A8D8CTS3_CULPI
MFWYSWCSINRFCGTCCGGGIGAGALLPFLDSFLTLSPLLTAVELLELADRSFSFLAAFFSFFLRSLFSFSFALFSLLELFLLFPAGRGGVCCCCSCSRWCKGMSW